MLIAQALPSISRVVQILQANVKLQFRPAKEHAFALQATIAKGWGRLYQGQLAFSDLMVNQGEPAFGIPVAFLAYHNCLSR